MSFVISQAQTESVGSHSYSLRGSECNSLFHKSSRTQQTKKIKAGRSCLLIYTLWTFLLAFSIEVKDEYALSLQTIFSLIYDYQIYNVTIKFLMVHGHMTLKQGKKYCRRRLAACLTMSCAPHSTNKGLLGGNRPTFDAFVILDFDPVF